MAAHHGPDTDLAERLERGEVIYYPTCPFAVPEGEDRRFLLEQQLGSRVHKNIGYDPQSGKTSGFLRQSPEQSDRLRIVLATFAENATGWLTGVLPRYAQSWSMDRVSYRPDEEATRRLRQMARNDLLHIDAFPSRPTNGHRILRLFVNINPTEPRIWVTTDSFAKLLAQYGPEVGLPVSQGASWMRRLQHGMLGIFQPGRRHRSVYDSFMLRFHNFLKANEDFQENCRKRYWSFAPGSAWMVITDTASHAVLRGRYALEHSYFLAPDSLVLPAEAPAALLEQACGMPVLQQAA
jgi:hypothetical protein